MSSGKTLREDESAGGFSHDGRAILAAMRYGKASVRVFDAAVLPFDCEYLFRCLHAIVAADADQAIPVGHGSPVSQRPQQCLFELLPLAVRVGRHEVRIVPDFLGASREDR